MSCSRTSSRARQCIRSTCFQSCVCPCPAAFFSNSQLNLQDVIDGVNIGGATGQVFSSVNCSNLEFRTIAGVTGVTVNTVSDILEVSIDSTLVEFVFDCTATAVAGVGSDDNFILNCYAYKLGPVTFIRMSRTSIAFVAQGYVDITINSTTLPANYLPSGLHKSSVIIQDGISLNNHSYIILRYNSGAFEFDVITNPFGTTTNPIIEGQTISWI